MYVQVIINIFLCVYYTLILLCICLLLHNLADCPQGCYNGKCASPNICTCYMGWTGLNCTKGINTYLVMHTSYSMYISMYWYIAHMYAYLKNVIVIKNFLTVSIFSRKRVHRCFIMKFMH